MHIKPLKVSGVYQLDLARLGTELTPSEKTALGLDADLKYEYAALNPDEIAFSISQTTAIRVVTGANQGGTVGNYYTFKGSTGSSNSVILENENYSNTSRWTDLGNSLTTEQQNELTVYDSDVTKNFKAQLEGKMYVIKPVNLEMPTISYVNITNLLIAQREKLLAWIESHGTDAEAITRYEVQLAALEQTLLDLGLAQYEDDPATLEVENELVIKKELDVLFLEMPDMYASPGSIFIEADPVAPSTYSSKVGTQLVARADAKIDIFNETPLTMSVNDAIVKDNRRVTVVDDELVVLTPGNVYFNNASLTPLDIGIGGISRAGDAQVTLTGHNLEVGDFIRFEGISQGGWDALNGVHEVKSVVDGNHFTIDWDTSGISQAYNPASDNGTVTPVKEIKIIQDAFLESAYDLGGLDIPDVPQDIYILGRVINENGNLMIDNREGSINVSGEIRAENVIIKAKGDFNLSTDDWLHTNKDPRQYIDYTPLRNLVFNDITGASDHDTYADLDGVPVPDYVGMPLQAALAILGLETAINNDYASILAQGRITITARYLNINGLIQSGTDTIRLNIAASFNPGPYTTNFTDDDGNPLSGITFGPPGSVQVPVDGYFDATQQAIVVEELVPKGGSITLAGQVFSTGNGRLKVANGYTNVEIQNDSGYDLVLDRIDVTTFREREITIIDTSTLEKVEYTVAGNQILEKKYAGTLVPGTGTEVSRIDYTETDSDTHDFTDDIKYYPTENQQYVWTEGQEKSHVEVYHYKQKSFNLLGFDWDALAADASWTDRQIYNRDATLLQESESVALEGTVIPDGSEYVPSYANGQAYTVAFERIRDIIVDLIPGQTLVKWLVEDDEGNPLGGDGNVYRYKDTAPAGEAILSEIVYDTDTNWEATDIDPNTFVQDPALKQYKSDFTNLTVDTFRDSWGGGWLRTKTYYTKITTVTGIKDYFTHTLKADYPVDIEFIQGPTNPAINITSVGDIRLQGEMAIPEEGTITLTSTGGSVVQTSSSAIYGANPTVNAAGSVVFNLQGNLDPSKGAPGTPNILNVTSNEDVRVILVSEDQTSSIVVGQIIANGADVILQAADGITAYDSTSFIKGNRIELFTKRGSIGTASQELVIDSHAFGSGGVAARADGDIYLQELSGDMYLVEPEFFPQGYTPEASIQSINGEVHLETVSGSILDAFYETFRPLSAEKASLLDQRMQLTGSSAREAAEAAIRTEENQNTNLCHLYWQNYRDLTKNGISSEFTITNIDGNTDEITFSAPHGLTTGDQIFFSLGLDLGSEDYTDTSNWSEIIADHDVTDGAVSLKNWEIVSKEGHLYRYQGANADNYDLGSANFSDASIWLEILPDYDVNSLDADARVAIRVGEIVKAMGGSFYRYQGEQITSPAAVLTSGEDYYVIVTDTNKVKLAATRYDAAISETPVAVDIKLNGLNPGLVGVGALRYNYSTNAYVEGLSVEAKYQEIHDTYGDQAYDPDFIYRISETERNQRIADRTFSADALNSPLPPGLLSYLYPGTPFLGASPSPFVSETPNVMGGDVFLFAGGNSSQIGRVTGKVTVDLSGGYDSLSAGDKVVLSSATAEDVMEMTYALYKYKGTNAELDLRAQDFSDGSLWEKIIVNYETNTDDYVFISQYQTVLVQYNKDSYGLYRYLGSAGSIYLSRQDYSDESRWQPIIANHGTSDGTVTVQQNQIVADQSVIESLTLQVWDDIDVEAADSFSGDAGDSIAIQTEGALKIDRVEAGGDVRLLAGGAITDLDIVGTDAAIATFGDLILSSGVEIDGPNSTDPLRIQLSTSSRLSAEALGDVHIKQVADDATIRGTTETVSGLFISRVTGGWEVKVEVMEGDMIVGKVSSATSIDLRAASDMLDAFDDADAPGVNIFTGNVTSPGTGDVYLQAGDNIGSSANFLDVEIRVGDLSSLSGDDTFVQSRGSLNVKDVTSTTGDVTLRVGGQTNIDMITATLGTATVDADGAIIDRLDDAASNIDANNIDLISHTSFIGSLLNRFEINSSYTMAGSVSASASGSIFLEETDGDMRVGLVRSTGADINLWSRKASIVDDDTDGSNDIDASDVLLFAQVGIGQTGNPLGATADNLEAKATTGGIWIDNTGNLFIGGVETTLGHQTIGLWAYDDIVVRAFSAHTVIEDVISETGDITLTAEDKAVSGDDDFTVTNGVTVWSKTGSVTLKAGDDFQQDAGTTINALTSITILGDSGNKDPGIGSNITVESRLLTDAILIAGERDDDTIVLRPQQIEGYTKVLGDLDGLPGGRDTMILDRLPSITTEHDRPGDGIGMVRDSVDLDGRGGYDTYIVNLTGGLTDYRVNILDSGAPDDGADILTINGTEDPDIFLLRRTSFIPGQTTEAPAFVALIKGTLDQVLANSPTRPTQLERINYDERINGRLTVNGLGGNDYFASDDNSTITTLDGGAGNDIFQIGQIYKTARVYDKVAPEDEFSTIETTRGFLSRGVSFPMTVYGGTGNDQFAIYSNKAKLRLEGNDGNDTFVVRAFALATGTGFSTEKTTEIDSGTGEDFIQYNINAPVAIDGGAGFDTVVVVGTEFNDDFVITEEGVFGAGLSIRYENIESVQVDGVEGNDEFFVLSTPSNMVMTVIGGLGSDTFNVGGDVTGTIVSRELEGRSGVIEHEVTSTADPNYNQLLAPGIDLNVAEAELGQVVITESGGSTLVREFGGGTIDTYTVRLATIPTANVYFTASATRSPRQDEEAGGDSIRVATGGSAFEEAVVLTFTPTNWMTAQTVSVKAIDDGLEEGERIYVVSHSVKSADLRFSSSGNQQVAIRNVEVTVRDDDKAGLIIEQTQNNTLVLEGTPITGITDTYTIQLTRPPAADKTVTVTLGIDTAQIGLANPTSDSRFDLAARTIIFDSTNWDTPVTVGVNAINDVVRENTLRSKITHTVSSTDTGFVVAGTKDLEAKVVDNDSAGLLVTETDGSTLVIKGDGTSANPGVPDFYDIRLTKAPSGDVKVKILSDDGQTLVDSTDSRFGHDLADGKPVVTFGTTNWYTPVTLEVSADPTFVPVPGTEFIKPFPVQSHTLSQIGGPLLIEGYFLEGANRSLAKPVMLPGEKNTLQSDGEVKSFEGTGASGAIDTMTVNTADLEDARVRLGLSNIGELEGKTLEIATGPGEGNNIVLGDSGYIDYVMDDDDRADIDRIVPTEPDHGSNDNISAGGGDDIIIGGEDGKVVVNDEIISPAEVTRTIVADTSNGDTIDAGNGSNVVFGDNGQIIAATADAPQFGSLPITLGLLTIITPDIGGNDEITTGIGKDIIFGGALNDTIVANDSEVYVRTGSAPLDDDNIIMGDNGFVDYTAAERTYPASDPAVDDDSDPSDIDRIAITDPTIGGMDIITSGAGFDLILGGTAGDIIRAGAGNDLVFGDHGKIEASATVLNGEVDARALPLSDAGLDDPFIFTAIHTQSADLGGNDVILSEDGEDIILGQQGDDRIYGGNDDDDIIGGHNVPAGHDGNDRIDGGSDHEPNDMLADETDNDVIAGDNASILRRGDTLSPRMRVLSGNLIYDSNDIVQVTSDPQCNPTGAESRTIVLFDHSHTPLPDTYGDDYIAGGEDDDVIFGQLGDDTIQGDGAMVDDVVDEQGDVVANPAAIPDVYAQRLPDGTLDLNASFELESDGDDYIEGNGGSDVIFGNLGQDDIIGGSSSLFSLTAPDVQQMDHDLRPDGADLIFGGAGTDIARNDLGDGQHTADADMILGDNGNIYRLVSVNGTTSYRVFNYDNYSEARRIIPRAAKLIDYSPGGEDYLPNTTGADYHDEITGFNDIGAADEIHGESGDDFIYGMKGNDILFGESQDDDIIGGYGNDWISGGTGRDGIIGDDGRIYTSRNSSDGVVLADGKKYSEPLYGILALLATDPDTRFSNGDVLNEYIYTPGKIQQSTINVGGELKKTVNLTPFKLGDPEAYDYDTQNPAYADDIIYGGWGSDFLHGGAGDDAISGAEALAMYYNAPFNPGDVLKFGVSRAGEFGAYNEYDPWAKVFWNQATGEFVAPTDLNATEFLLNFNAGEGPVDDRSTSITKKTTDGDDRIFGDLGNDWLVGGTGKDHLYGGYGFDLLNVDDDHDSTNNNDGILTPSDFANNIPDTDATYEDIAYGGAGRDVLIANMGGAGGPNLAGDRLIDWCGEFNSYIVPFAPFGMATVSRTLQPQLPEYLYALSRSDGADPTRAADTNISHADRNGEPEGELGLVRQKDPNWHDQTGAPDDPQAGNIPGGKRDVL